MPSSHLLSQDLRVALKRACLFLIPCYIILCTLKQNKAHTFLSNRLIYNHYILANAAKQYLSCLVLRRLVVQTRRLLHDQKWSKSLAAGRLD